MAIGGAAPPGSGDTAVATTLHSETARATAKVDGQQHLEELKRHNLLGLERPVRVVARRCPPGTRPQAGQKVVHLIRHGQGFHNLIADLYRDFGRKVDSTGMADDSQNPYRRPEVVDPPLTAVGRSQASALQPTTKQLAGVQLVVTSPLRRAVETALLAFAHLVEEGKARVPFVSHDGCQETQGVNVCDKRRPLSEIRAEFPMVDFGAIKDEVPKWSDAVRETPREVSDRGHAFMLWLRSRPESEVAVATHSAFLHNMLNTAVECEPEELAEWFLTGELRSVLVSFEDGSEQAASAKRARTA